MNASEWQKHQDSLVFQVKLDGFLKRIRDVLIEKNRNYGNAALEPLNIFSKLDAGEGIRVRIDDKLKRLQTQEEGDQEDTLLDLLGYLVLLHVYRETQSDTEGSSGSDGESEAASTRMGRGHRQNGNSYCGNCKTFGAWIGSICPDCRAESHRMAMGGEVPRLRAGIRSRKGIEEAWS